MPVDGITSMSPGTKLSLGTSNNSMTEGREGEKGRRERWREESGRIIIVTHTHPFQAWLNSTQQIAYLFHFEKRSLNWNVSQCHVAAGDCVLSRRGW